MYIIYISSIFIYYNGWNKKPTKNLSTEELIDELISVENISSKLSDLTSRFDDFLRRYEILNSEPTVSKNYNTV